MDNERRDAVQAESATLRRGMTESRTAQGAREAAAAGAVRRVAAELLTEPVSSMAALQRLPSLLVPVLADWAVLWLPGEDGTASVSVAHVDAAAEDVLLRLWRDADVASWSGHPVADVLRTGEPSLLPHVGDADIDALPLPPDRRALLRQLAPRSWLAVPVATGRGRGALLFGSASEACTFGGRDMAIASEIAALAELYIDNQVLRAERDRIRHAAEQQLRLQARLLDAVDQAVIATDLQGSVLYWNDGATRLYGWTAEEAVGRSIVELTPAAEQTDAAVAIMAQLQAGGTWSGKFHVRRRDGSTFLAHVTDSPFQDADGRLAGVVGISYDCTAEQQLLEAERASALQARQAVREREELVAVVSHDLRNPLNVLTMASGLLLEAELSEEKKAAQVRLIRRVVGNMRRLIEDLLDVARLSAGGLQLEVQPVAVERLLEQTTSQIIPLAEARSLTLHVDVGRGADAVRGDAARLGQVLENLLSNAVRYAPEGTRISVTAHAAGDNVEFSVEDHGPGVPVEDRSHLFDRYWQGHRRRGGGAGLGLAICKGIVEAHGGRIWLDEQVACGTTMRFTVPAAPVAAEGGG